MDERTETKMKECDVFVEILIKVDPNVMDPQVAQSILDLYCKTNTKVLVLGADGAYRWLVSGLKKLSYSETPEHSFSLLFKEIKESKIGSLVETAAIKVIKFRNEDVFKFR